MWQLYFGNGIGYADVIKKYPEKYELYGGNIWSKELSPRQKLAESKGISRRPFSRTSITIEYNLNNTSSREFKKIRKTSWTC